MRCFIVDYAQHQIAIDSCQCGSWEALDYHPETISSFLCIWRTFFPDVSNDDVDVGTTGGEDPALHVSAIGLAPNDILRWRNMVVTRVNILQLKVSRMWWCHFTWYLLCPRSFAADVQSFHWDYSKIVSLELQPYYYTYHFNSVYLWLPHFVVKIQPRFICPLFALPAM